MSTRTSRPAFPPELARHVVAHWPEATPLAVSCEVLEDALSAAFHASMTFDEGRATRFRLLLTPADRLPETGIPNEGVLRLKFDRSRALTPDELRKLAQAVPFETSLIGAQVEEEGLRIWGIAHSGPAWLAPSWGGRDVVPNWTYDPIIHVNAPGNLAVRCAGTLIGALERGELADSMMDVFDAKWLGEMFAREREEVRAKHAARQANAHSPTAVEHSLVARVGQHMLRRVLRLVRQARHGALILLSSDNKGLRSKYVIAQDEPAHRYRTLLFRILEVVAASTSKSSAGWEDFVGNASPDVAALERGVFEWSRVIANLAAVDGAVVIDRRFGLLGFGAEVSGDLAMPARVWRALDLEGKQRRPEDIESVGTRHRAAYRFVHAHEDALAIVVSQDGGVTFVANQDGDVVLWEHAMSP